MIARDYDIVHFGECSLLIQVKEPPSISLLEWLLDKREVLSKTFNVEVIHTYNELLLKEILTIESLDSIRDQIDVLLQEKIIFTLKKPQIHKIPVCYDSICAIDMEVYSQSVGLSIEEVIRIHTSVTYTVYFMGFLPGFAYLDGLDPRLYLNRKATPSRSIKTGSVAIGGSQTGIYPQSSPGGWHSIGRTPIQLFDRHSKGFTIFKPADKLEFYPIEITQFEEMNNTMSR